MTARRVVAVAGYWLAFAVLPLLAVVGADCLPITDPATAWGADVSAGCAVIAALTWLPRPSRRKDSRRG